MDNIAMWKVQRIFQIHWISEGGTIHTDRIKWLNTNRPRSNNIFKNVFFFVWTLFHINAS